MKLCLVLSILIPVIICAFRPNVRIEFEELKSSNSSALAYYNVLPFNNNVKIPFDLDKYFNLKKIDNSTKTVKCRTLTMIFESKNNSKLIYIKQNECKRIETFSLFRSMTEFDITDLLSQVYKCKNQLPVYKSQFYLLDMKYSKMGFDGRVNASFPMYIESFWVIGINGSESLDNKRNFKEFLFRCHDFSYAAVGLLVFCGFLMTVMVGFVFYGWYFDGCRVGINQYLAERKRNKHPIITVTPAPVTKSTAPCVG
jgi:hypothetical protein